MPPFLHPVKQQTTIIILSQQRIQSSDAAIEIFFKLQGCCAGPKEWKIIIQGKGQNFNNRLIVRQ